MARIKPQYGNRKLSDYEELRPFVVRYGAAKQWETSQQQDEGVELSLPYYFK